MAKSSIKVPPKNAAGKFVKASIKPTPAPKSAKGMRVTGATGSASGKPC